MPVISASIPPNLCMESNLLFSVATRMGRAVRSSKVKPKAWRMSRNSSSLYRRVAALGSQLLVEPVGADVRCRELLFVHGDLACNMVGDQEEDARRVWLFRQGSSRLTEQHQQRQGQDQMT